MTVIQSNHPMLEPQTEPSYISQSFRVLFLAPFAPRLQASHGGGRVIAQLIAQLTGRHSIGLCYLRAAGEPAMEDGLRERCEIVEEVILPGHEVRGVNRWSRRLRVWKDLIAGKPLWAIDRFSPAFGERVKTILKTWRPDIVQLEFHIMGQYLSAFADDRTPRILVQHELGEESARENRRSSFRQGLIIPQLDLLAWKRFEREVIQQVQSVVVFTERDRRAVHRLGGQTPVVQIPLGTEVSELSLQTVEDEAPSLLFVGNFKHLPNLDAADRLINKIFPQVQSQFPQARLFIVGDHLPSNMMRMPNENIILTGFVPDVKPYLDRAALVVVPLRWGGGMRVKVLEALANGKAVVASALAMEGLDVEDGRHVVLAESDQEFSSAMMELLRNPERRARLAREAHAWAYANLSWEKAVSSYEALYQRLLRDDYVARLVA